MLYILIDSIVPCLFMFISCLSTCLLPFRGFVLFYSPFQAINFRLCAVFSPAKRVLIQFSTYLHISIIGMSPFRVVSRKYCNRMQLSSSSPSNGTICHHHRFRHCKNRIRLSLKFEISTLASFAVIYGFMCRHRRHQNMHRPSDFSDWNCIYTYRTFSSVLTLRHISIWREKTRVGGKMTQTTRNTAVYPPCSCSSTVDR